MVTLGHLRVAWTHALDEINAAIKHLESGEGADVAARDQSSKATEAWLVVLQRHRREYTELLNDYPITR